MWTIALLVLILIGVVLVLIGLQGRPIDDHPLCWHCGYDLIGQAKDADRCPECGTSVAGGDNVCIGHYVRRGRFIAAGLGLAVLCGALLLGDVGHFDFEPYKPVWWLKAELKGSPSIQATALTELKRRVDAGRLDKEDVLAIADRCLAVQGNLAMAWQPQWGEFVESAEKAGILDAARWATYARQSGSLQLQVRPIIRQGDALAIQWGASPSSGRSGNAFPPFRVFFDYTFEIDGRKVETLPTATFPYHDGCFAGGSLCYQTLSPFDGSFSRTLAVGSHLLRAKVKLLYYEMHGRSISTLEPVDFHGKLAVGDVDLPATFNIVAPGDGPALTRVDPRLRDSVRKAIMIEDMKVRSANSKPEVDLAAFFMGGLPLRFVFRVFVRPAGGAGGEMELEQWPGHGGIQVDSAKTSSDSAQGFNLYAPGALGGADQADVIFRPDLKAIPDSVDLTPAWGEEVIFRDVPVKRK